jgi:hypothetical protein
MSDIDSSRAVLKPGLIKGRPQAADGEGMSPRPARSTLVAFLIGLAAPIAAQAAPPQVKIRPAPGFVKRYHPGTSAKAPTHFDTPQDIHVDLAAQVRASRLSGMRAFTVSGSQQFLPTTWCPSGVETTVDDTIHAAQLPDEPFYKVVYAYAADQPDRFNLWKNQLQANASLIGQFMSQQDGATKAPRFDMGTSCGPQYLDVQTIALPLTKASYNDNFTAIKADVAARLGTASAKRNVLILADMLTTHAANSLYGLGEHYNGGSSDTPGAGNPHNIGSLYSALFPPVGYNPPTVAGQQFYPGFWPEGMLHEVSHTLGAVNYSAPHTSAGAEGPRGHCTDGYDVMCYADGANPTVPYTTTACPQIAGSGGLVQTYDCGGDDYFNPSPAPGSYLDTHWNLYNSIFESSCATIGFACGADSAVLPAGVARPRVTGTAKVGNTLSADRGTWSGAPDSYAYQWQRTPSGGPTVDIGGATNPAYVLVAADATAQVQVQVTATNSNGSGASTSLTAAVPAYNPPVNTAPPTIAGTARRTSVLTATTGAWTGSASKAFKWQRLVGASWTDIASQIGATYTLAAADVGTSVRVLETATNADGPASVPSDAVGPVLGATPVLQTAPAVTGTVQRTRTLTAFTGTWSDSPSSYGYQWQRDTGTGFGDIALATAQTYVPVAGDLGADLRVLVTATNGEGASTAAPSAAVGPVDDLHPPANTAPPGVSGLATNGHTLTADPGAWDNAPTAYSYQWQRDTGSGFGAIPLATAATYVLQAADVGALVRVQVTATNGDGPSAAASSGATAPVADVPQPVNSARPAISGVAQAGHALTATDGTWSHVPTSFQRHWQRETGSVFSDVAGATNPTLALATGDVGHRFRVVVVASNVDGDSLPVASDPTAAVVAADVVAPPVFPPADILPVTPGDQPPVADPRVDPTELLSSAFVRLKRGRRMILRLRVSSRVSASGVVATTTPAKVKLRNGKYKLKLCAGAACVTRSFTVKGGKVKLPKVVVSAPASGAITLTLLGPGGAARGKL